MTFIEQLFGISPDGGSGSLEFVLLAVPLFAILYWRVSRTARKQRAR